VQKHIMASLAAAAFIVASSAAASADDATTGLTFVVTTSTDPVPTNRDFHPDYSPALTVDQVTAVWNAEIARVFQPVLAGGG
jgi:hypothetical protein